MNNDLVRRLFRLPPPETDRALPQDVLAEIEWLLAERDALRALLAEARERETRYVLPLYRDSNYLARIDAALAKGE